MVRSIDNLGRIVIPIEIRRRLKMDSGTPCRIRVNGTEVILSRGGSDERHVTGVMLEGDERQGVCPFCKNELMERFNKTCCGSCGNEIIWSKEEEKF
ncbi:AbrB/MazE/SpoVT family DNA-binding domain-containing protein [Lacrimispora amygdalina]|uniref:AbrB/MazE/SpoVT family DNA-binding domain-containing protein n=1 Tax=Lacrimispora amygdalina TaxID=253257 RepID=UPI000BE48419|nr:AbrB/MazE/SpoVT family DNA-binding domain-containing protein [Lacrimispora amygdalina]